MATESALVLTDNDWLLLAAICEAYLDGPEDPFVSEDAKRLCRRIIAAGEAGEEL